MFNGTAFVALFALLVFICSDVKETIEVFEGRLLVVMTVDLIVPTPPCLSFSACTYYKPGKYLP